MFTGLIADLGRIRRVTPRGGDVAIEVEPARIRAATLELGESVAVNGVCLTVVARDEALFAADASAETLRRTTLGGLRPGDRVHLERAVRVGDRLGGHLVQGHVDGVGRLARRAPAGRAWDLWFDLDSGLERELVPKGSVTIDGVSLTVNDLEGDLLRVTIVPHTEAETLLAAYPVGTRCNVETDIIGKYVRRALAGHAPGGVAASLERLGYTTEGG